MSRYVFILGAGASRAAGAPLMSNFISIAQTVRPKLSQEESAAFELVFRARAKLQQIFSKAQLDINNVESLFGTFEMARLLGKLGDLSLPEIERLPQAMNTFI